MNPYLIIGLLLAWSASLFGVGIWQNQAGHVAERTTWQDRENAELRTANGKLWLLEEGARKAEQDHAAALAAISTDYEGKLTYANEQRAADVAAVRAGTVRLRDPNPPSLRACSSAAAETGASAGGRDDRAPGELSEQAAAFLFDLANDADDIARQLGACQRVVAADRAL